MLIKRKFKNVLRGKRGVAGSGCQREVPQLVHTLVSRVYPAGNTSKVQLVFSPTVCSILRLCSVMYYIDTYVRREQQLQQQQQQQ